jgi:hypothetical protein
MTREELANWYGKASPPYYDQEALDDAMVAAYNRGLEDAVELLQDNPDYDVEAARKLRI